MGEKGIRINFGRLFQLTLWWPCQLYYLSILSCTVYTRTSDWVASNCAIEKDQQLLTELVIYSAAQAVLQKWLSPLPNVHLTREMLERLSIFLMTDVAFIELEYLFFGFPVNSLDECQ